MHVQLDSSFVFLHRACTSLGIVLPARVQTWHSQMHYDVPICAAHGTSPWPKPACGWRGEVGLFYLLMICDILWPPYSSEGYGLLFYSRSGPMRGLELWELCWQSPCSSSSSDKKWNRDKPEKQIDSQDSTSNIICLQKDSFRCSTTIALL